MEGKLIDITCVYIGYKYNKLIFCSRMQSIKTFNYLCLGINQYNDRISQFCLNVLNFMMLTIIYTLT